MFPCWVSWGLGATLEWVVQGQGKLELPVGIYTLAAEVLLEKGWVAGGSAMSGRAIPGTWRAGFPMLHPG